MSASSLVLAAGIVFMFVCAGGLVWAGRWMMGREQARQTWHVPEAADVAASEADILADAERVVLQADMVAMLDAVMPHAKAIGEAVSQG